MVFLRVHRRATSVPVGDPELSDDSNLLAAKNSYLFSRAVIDNADALSTASRRNDEQFLRDLNARIGSASFSQPPVTRSIRRASVALGPSSPSVTRRRSIAVGPVLRPPLVTDDDDVDVDYEVKLIAPLTNRLTRYGRATSVPPIAGGVLSSPGVGKSVLIHSAHHPESRFILTGRDEELHNKPIIVDLETPTQVNSTFQKLNPVADLAVRQAHRNLDRIEREIKSSGDVIISNQTSPRTVLYTASTDGPWRRSVSYHGPRSSSVRIRSQSPAGRTAPTGGRRFVRRSYVTPSAAVLSDDELLEYLAPVKLDKNVKAELLSSGTNPDPYSTRIHHPLPSISHPVGRSSGLTDVLLYDLGLNTAGDIAVPSTVSSNILRKVSPGSNSLLIHSATHHTKPLHTLVTPYVATATHVSPKPPVATVTARPIPPAPAKSSISPGLPPVDRPKMSEMRRKVRDVLCKVKEDPHYFD